MMVKTKEAKSKAMLSDHGGFRIKRVFSLVDEKSVLEVKKSSSDERKARDNDLMATGQRRSQGSTVYRSVSRSSGRGDDA